MLYFLIWRKIVEIGLRRTALIPFSVVPCLDGVDFYACLKPVLSFVKNEDNSDRSLSNMDTGNWLYYTTPTNPVLSSIERPELSFDFGCWTRGGVIFGIWFTIGYFEQTNCFMICCLSCQSILPLSKAQFHWPMMDMEWRALTVDTLLTCYGVHRSQWGEAVSVW